jgi:hypothetical protein
MKRLHVFIFVLNKDLETNCSHIVKELTMIAKYMIAKMEERITIMELVGEVDRVGKIYRDTTAKKRIKSVEDENKKSKLISEEAKKHFSSSSG